MARYGSLPFAEQIRFFRQKELIPTERWADVWRDEHDAGFMVAGAASVDLLADLHRDVSRAINEGVTIRDFRRDFDRTVARHGWTGWRGEGTPEGRAWRTRLIYETNLRTSYQAGRWAQVQAVKDRRPYLIYRHSDLSTHPRPLHKSWDGKVLAVDDPWWQAHWPPNGWGCKCRAFSLSRSDLEALGKSGPDEAPFDGVVPYIDKVTGERHLVPAGIDPGWDYAPGASLTAKADAWPENIPRPAESWANPAQVELRRRVEQVARAQGKTPDALINEYEAILRRQMQASHVFLRVDRAGLERLATTGEAKSSFGLQQQKSWGPMHTQAFRSSYEGKVFALSPDAPTRPVYGYLSESDEGNIGGNFQLDAFGEFAVRLKPQVKKRTTASGVSVTGAMSSLPDFVPRPVLSPRHEMMEWAGAKDAHLMRPYDIDDPMRYYEAQVFGGLTLDDIEEVTMVKAPPKMLAKLLDEAGIRWRVVDRVVIPELDDDVPF